MLFFRGVGEYLGPVVVFEPDGYHEKVTPDGRDVEIYWIFDIPCFRTSTVPEVCFAGSLAGGFLSTAQWLVPGPYYVYATDEEPDVDLRGFVGYGDFGVTQEVRYRRPVTARFIRRIDADRRFVRQFQSIQAHCCNGYHYDDAEARRLLRKAKRRYAALSERAAARIFAAGVSGHAS